QRGIHQPAPRGYEDTAQIVTVAFTVQIVTPLKPEILVLWRSHGGIHVRKPNTVERQHNVVRGWPSRDATECLVYGCAFVLYAHERELMIAHNGFQEQHLVADGSHVAQ